MRAIPCGAVSVRTALLAAAPMVPAAGKGIDDRPTWIAPRYRKMARRLRNSRPLAIERKTHPLDPCTLKQSSPKPRAIFRYLGAIQVGRSSIPFPAARTIGAAATRVVHALQARDIGTTVLWRPASCTHLRSRIGWHPSASLPDARSSRHRRRKAMSSHPPTSGPPRCRKNPWGFGEDCLSVQGSNAALRAFDRWRPRVPQPPGHFSTRGNRVAFSDAALARRRRMARHRLPATVSRTSSIWE